MKYEYYTPDDPKELYEIESVFKDDDLEIVACECAEDIYDNHDGWEFMPGNDDIKVVVIDSKNKHRSFKISIEFEPEFYAYEEEVE